MPEDNYKGLGIFADLHCHPGNIPFHRLRNTDKDPEHNPNTTEFSIWNIPKEDWERRKKLYEIKDGKSGWESIILSTVPQCDFYSLSQGKVRIVFAALYPMERGFFQGNARKKLSGDIISQGIKMIKKRGWRFVARVISFFLPRLKAFTSILLNSSGFARDMLQQFLMKFHDDRIDFVQGQKKDKRGEYYDYFHELELEYKFFLDGEGKTGMLDEDNNPVETYAIAKDGNHLGNIIHDSSETATILTMEGMHSLTQVHDKKNKPTRLGLVDWDELQKRIDIVKSWNLFFITFSHHFDNGIAGHARSIPDIIQEITDQSPGRNEGITEMGLKTVKKLLAIDSYSGERRVLIDVKHMSAAARIDYYEVVDTHNASNPGDKIPIIASHVGYADTRTLEELRDRAHLEKDDYPDNEFFTAWGINVCDEDIKKVVETEGLIGLSFDQRIMGVKETIPTDGAGWASVIANNIYKIVYASKNEVSADPQNIWNCLALGTDFDGYINPLDPFPTCREFKDFTGHLLRFFEELPQEAKTELFLDSTVFTPAEVIEKISYRNALEFTLKNFK